MPFYTYKCPKCKKEKEVIQSMSAPAPECDGTKMKRIFKPNARPGSEDGSWNFNK